jgi:type IV pilus assembly protein PilB
VTLVAAGEDQIIRTLDQIFGTTSERPRAVPDPLAMSGTTQVEPPEPDDDERPATLVVEELLRKAIKEEASDIHIEPHEHTVVTRLRHDGMLGPGPPLPRSIFPSVLTRIKILADLNIAENRLPQDGRILHQLDDRRLDLRVSVFPTIHGENVAIRVLDKNRSFGLESLGLAPKELALFRQCLTRQHGLFLVTGPTGSGKTTTLYSALSEINSVEQNIVTLEDPVEYELPGIRQTQVNPRAGLTFVVGLRALLRQDPDVMLVGEMRDLETVEIAIRSAMTGHLVFSTLHTNEALGAIPRLMDMGVASYLLSSSLIGVLAQRLVRTICQECKVQISAEEAGLARLGEVGEHVTATFAGKGCASCKGNGYRGRTGVFELFVPQAMHLAAIAGDPDELKRLAIERGGLVPMVHQAIAKVSAGITTVDEVVRSVFSEVSE